MHYIFLIIFVFLTSNVIANEVLTVKQQLDRLRQEVQDLNNSVYSTSNNDNKNKDIARFQSIDLRIYDLEKDIKNLTLQFEKIIFKLDDLSNYMLKIEEQLDTSNVFLKLKELEARIIMLE